MSLFDMRTVVLSYAFSNFICLVVVTNLWIQNRRRFAGLDFWLGDFVLQFFSLVLVVLRGTVPDFFSMTVGNAMAIGGTILLYIGLGHFFGERRRQAHNYALLTTFVLANIYYVFIFPSLAARNILISLGLLAICSQCAWLVLRRTTPREYPGSLGVGLVMIAFCVVSLVRIIVDLSVPLGEDFLHSNTYDTLLLMTYQMLFILLTFCLILMVNRRLFADLESDIAGRKEAEHALQASEERYQAFFSQSFEAIYRTEFDRPIDIALPVEEQIDQIYVYAYLAECNQAMADMYHQPSPDAMTGIRLLDAHGGSTNPVNRAAFRKFIEGGYRSTNDETVEYDSQGNPVWFLNNTVGIIENDHLVRMWGTSIEITDRKRAEEALRASEEKFFKAFQTSPDSITISRLSDGHFVDVNEGFCRLTGYTRQEALASSSVALELWGDPRGREKYVATLREHERFQDQEFVFRTKAGDLLTCLCSAEIINLGGAPHILSVIRDITESKRVQEALRESEAIFSSFLDNSPVYVFFKDMDVRVLRLSRNYEQMLGLPISEMIGKTMDELFPSDLAKSMVADDLRILNEGRRVDVVEEMNGRIYETTKFPVFKDGKPEMLAGFTLDITARKRMEDALRESEAKYRSILQTALDGYLELDEQGCIVQVNDAYCRMSGYSEQEILGRRISDFDVDYSPERVAVRMQKAITQGRDRFDTRHRHKDGSFFDVEVSVQSQDGRFVSFVHDVTERRGMELALRAEKVFTERALDAQQDTFFVFNPTTGKAIRWNRAFRDTSGYTDAEISRLKAPDAYYAQKDLEITAQAIKEIFEKGSKTIELEFICKDGRKIPFEYVASFMDGDSGEPELLIAVGRDITERKRSEAALQHQNDILAALQQTTLDLLSELDLDILLENIVKRAGLLLGTTAGYLDLVESKTGQLMPRVSMGALAESLGLVVQPGEGVAGVVWQSGKALIIEDYDQWDGRLDKFSRGTIRSIVGVPLLSGSKVLGVLGLAYDVSSAQIFTQDDVELLTQFARLAVIAIENARLYQAAQQELVERKRAEAIIRLRLRLWEYSIAHSVEDLMQKALDEIEILTDSSISFYHFVNEDQNSLSLQAWSTRTASEFCRADGKDMHYSIDKAGVWTDCIRERAPVIHNDYASLPHRRGMPDGHARVIRELVVPTMRENRVVSILGIGNKASDYDDQDAELVAYIADLVWSIIEQRQAAERILQLNGQLERLAMTDELTGLANRRSFFLQGGEEILRSQRYQTPFSLIMLDIDGFKNVNDSYGHDSGDVMLQCVAETLRRNARETDLVARLGGEEFAVLLPNTAAGDAENLAERLRMAIEAEERSVQDRVMKVTVSVGVAAYHEDMANLDVVLHNADAAMYQAKSQGRNRVVLFTD